MTMSICLSTLCKRSPMRPGQQAASCIRYAGGVTISWYSDVLLGSCSGKFVTSPICISILLYTAPCCSTLELETKVKQRFAKISQSRRKPLLGPSPG